MTSLFARAASVSTRFFAPLVIAGAVTGFFFPAAFIWVLSLMKVLLGIIMLGMGMTLTIEDFKRVLEKPRYVFTGVACQYVFMSALAWLTATLLNLPPLLAVGVVLVGTCPGGTASNVITYLARGDVALSVSMTTVSTLFSPLFTPLLTRWLAGSSVAVDTGGLFVSILQIVLIPVIAGVILRHAFKRQSARLTAVFPLISVAVIVLIVAAVVGANRINIVSSAGIVFLAVLIHNGLGLISGYGMARLMKMPQAQLRALTIEIGMQNSGLAVGLAKEHFDPIAALPGALFSVWHNITGPLLATFWNRQDRKASMAGTGEQSL
ncbi:MAG: bile acid:sodium symporter family protein [Geobacteraceae bacterium]|nr:bile acid:sodium symporter family protein [Geobacteraceae bacterium]